MKNTESTGEPYDVVIDGDGYLEPYEDIKQPNEHVQQSIEKPTNKKSKKCVYYLIFIGILLLIMALVFGIICEFN